MLKPEMKIRSSKSPPLQIQYLITMVWMKNWEIAIKHMQIKLFKSKQKIFIKTQSFLWVRAQE